MFEIEDDDDGFWEKLPLDQIEFHKVETKSKSSTSNSISTTINGGSNFPANSFKSISNVSNKTPSLDFHINGGISSNNKTGRQQLASIHNVLTSNDRSHLASVSASTSSANNISITKTKTHSVEVEDPLVIPRQTNCSTNDNNSNEPSCSRNERPYKSGSKRKFPGPAGVLPESFPSDPNKLQPASPVVVDDAANSNSEVIPLSQPSSSCDPFSSKPWLSLLSDIGKDAKSVLNKFAIRTMLLKAAKRVLPKGKIPLVLAFVDSVDFHGCDGTVVLRDPSGKVHGALHNDLVRDPSTALKPGCVIVLRQTSVISPTPRNQYLNITPINIVVIYSQTKDSTTSTVRKSPWSPTIPSSFVSSSSSSSSSPPLPSLAQIIQDSDNELISALVSNPTPPQQQQTIKNTPRTPNSSHSNVSLSLFGSVHTNINSPSSPFPPHHFPATANNNTTSPNTQIYNRFKSPVPLHGNRFSNHRPSSNQMYPTTNISNSNSFHTNTPTPKSHTDTNHNRYSSNHTMGSNINNQSSMTINSFSNEPLSTARQNMPSSNNQSFLATNNNNFFNQPSTSRQDMPPSSSNSTPNSRFPFSGNQSNHAMGNSNNNNNRSSIAINGTFFNQPSTSGQSMPLSSHTTVNSNSRFQFYGNQSPSTMATQLPVSNSNQIQAQTSDTQHDEFSDDDNDLLSLCDDSDSICVNKNSSTNQIQNVSELRTISDNSNNINTKPIQFDGGGGRDVRVQLGVSKPTQQAVTKGHEPPSFGTWDDDLDDELLSQL